MRARTRRLIAAIVLGLLLAAPTGATEPSPSPGSPQAPISRGGRIDVPGAGFSITVPEDWTVVVPSAGDVEALIATLEDDDPQLAEAARAVVSMGLSYELLAAGPRAPLADFEQCYVVTAPNPLGAGLDELVATNLVSTRVIPGLVGEPSSTYVDLPAGRAGRIDAITRRELSDRTELDVYLSLYLVMGDGVAYGVNCVGMSPREDAWMSIMTTFALLSPSASPAMPGLPSDAP